MGWIDRSGDRDRDGFQEYETRSTHGYYNQGWKDAGDAIPHEDGSLAPLPLALVRAPGLRLRREAPDGGPVRGHRPAGRTPTRLRREARTLYDRFNDAFWWEAEGTYYLGLDGQKRPIRTVASNAGHLLQSGSCRPSAPGGSWSGCCATTCGRGGGSGPCRRTTCLQPVLVPHRDGLAARQRDDRRRVPALRLRGRGGAGRARRCSTPPRGSPAPACPSCSRACPATRRRSRSSTWARTCPRRGRRARSSASWR